MSPSVLPGPLGQLKSGMDEDLGHDYDTDLDVRLRDLCSRCSGGVDADLLPH